MINKIIQFSIHNKLVVGLLTIGLIIAGVFSASKIPVDAVPDITNNQVQIITQAPNLGTEEIEQFVTYPVEIALANLPGVTEIRSISRFGLSVVTIVFDDGLDTYLPRQLVSEKLGEINAKIPEGFGKPFMGPISTGLGEIYQYTLDIEEGYKDKYSPQKLREIQDWIIKRQMAMVPGVVEVNSFGGHIKQYEVAIDPEELNALGLTIKQVYTALERNNQNTGGAYIEKDHQANFIRGEGLAKSIDDIKNIVVRNKNDLPILIKDIGVVSFGSAIRYGAVTKNGEGEAVGGMIMMLKGANTNSVINAVNERVALIQKSLPEGVRIKPFLDRSKLIENTTKTVQNNLFEGALIVLFILVFFLGNWRGGIIVASTIPLALLFAFILMYVFDVWANLMSLGAIDFGIIVDGSVIIVESTVFYIYKHITSKKVLTQKDKDVITYKASSKMMNTAFFGQFIILIVFLPILSLEGVEGKMFKPMAFTFMFAMIGAMILCLTYVPMVTSLFLTAPKVKHKRSYGYRAVHWVERIYGRALIQIMGYSKIIVGIAILMLTASIYIFSNLGGEFIPKLDEGDIAFHVILKPGSALSETVKATTKVEKLIKQKFPEVIDVISRIGVADVPTDPMPMDLADVFLILKPVQEWTSASSKPELIDKIKEMLERIPGINYEFSQPIEMRFNELITGVREDIAIKLYGENLNVLSKKANEIGVLVSDIDGVADLKVEATSGQPQITIEYNRRKIAQYGLAINDMNRLVETAFAGGVAGVVFEGEKRFDLVVRLKKELRQELYDVENLFVSLPNGSQIPLKELAEISFKPGPMQISRDNTNRRIYVGINVRGRDIKTLVEEIQLKIEQNIKLPAGYYIRYGGAFENLERATKKLKTVVPIALILIFVLIFFALKSFKQTMMIYMAIPLATIGGVLSLYMRGMSFSISAGIGFIVLFGVAVLNGLVLVSGFNELKEEGVTDLNERIKEGTKRRIRPILLTALTDMLGFLPMALSTTAGAEVQRPLATVVIGGLLTSTLLTLFIIPILYKAVENFNQQRSIKRSNLAVTILFIGFMLFPSLGSSQNQKIDLNQAIELAQQNYPELIVADLEIEKERAIKSTAWDFGNTKIFTMGDEIGDDGNGTYTTLGLGQSNIALFSIASKNKLANENIKLAETNKSLNTIQLKQRVEYAWIKAFTTKKIYESYKEIDTVYSGLKKALELRYETKAISNLEFQTTINQGELIKLQKEQYHMAYKIAVQELNQWLFADQYFDIADVSIELMEEPLDLVEINIESHPLISLWESELSVAKAESKVYSSKYLPTVSAQYGFQKIGNENGFNSYQVGIQLPLIFSKAKGESKASKLNVEIIEQNNKIKQLKLANSFKIAMANYMRLKENWEYHKSHALPLAVQQRDGATLAYQEGSMSYIAFIQTIKNAIELEINSWTIFQQYSESKINVSYFLETKNE
ncbi:CusA/CzcA family heavy metal efflux RND transporter [Flavicella sp.]|uniref:CusA/CzcA family heavy metal efflux RND transporter n=1 Tax=Flavicella sp. TaxID=2957742 RepID=UPI0026315790|nr:CusA/CzcA family heavy metal efflux RND transporter [Flavicella sp.]MDG1804950.1 CusA/CzcA family heavy metal efflux RND transporter [Flavicella sp.]